MAKQNSTQHRMVLYRKSDPGREKFNFQRKSCRYCDDEKLDKIPLHSSSPDPYDHERQQLSDREEIRPQKLLQSAERLAPALHRGVAGTGRFLQPGERGQRDLLSGREAPHEPAERRAMQGSNSIQDLLA